MILGTPRPDFSLICSCKKISDSFSFTGTDSPRKNPSIVCAGGSVPLDKISILSENTEIIGSFPLTHRLCKTAFIIASLKALLSNNGVSGRSTTRSLSSVWIRFNTSAYSDSWRSSDPADYKSPSAEEPPPGQPRRLPSGCCRSCQRWSVSS